MVGLLEVRPYDSNPNVGIRHGERVIHGTVFIDFHAIVQLVELYRIVFEWVVRIVRRVGGDPSDVCIAWKGGVIGV